MNEGRAGLPINKVTQLLIIQVLSSHTTSLYYSFEHLVQLPVGISINTTC